MTQQRLRIDSSWLIIYLTPVKTQLLQYNLTLDLMLFCHSYQIKIKIKNNIWSRYQSIGADKAVKIRLAVFLIQGHNPNSDTKKAKSPNLFLDIRSSLCHANLGSHLLKIAITFYVLCTRNQKNVS